MSFISFHKEKLGYVCWKKKKKKERERERERERECVCVCVCACVCVCVCACVCFAYKFDLLSIIIKKECGVCVTEKREKAWRCVNESVWVLGHKEDFLFLV
jgi:hypothetical protein